VPDVSDVAVWLKHRDLAAVGLELRCRWSRRVLRSASAAFFEVNNAAVTSGFREAVSAGAGDERA
jgi:hypothetical protein